MGSFGWWNILFTLTALLLHIKSVKLVSVSGQNACLMLSTALKSIMIIKKWNNECYILNLLTFKAHSFYIFFWIVGWIFWHLVGLDAKIEVNEHLKLSQPACYCVCTPLLLCTVTSKGSFMFKSVITHATDNKLVTKGVLICLTTVWSKLQENISSHHVVFHYISEPIEIMEHGTADEIVMSGSRTKYSILFSLSHVSRGPVFSQFRESTSCKDFKY